MLLLRERKDSFWRKAILPMILPGLYAEGEEIE
jgi:hypothetical protein